MSQFQQTATVALLVDAESAIITFPVEFSVVPFSVIAAIQGDGTQNIFCTVDDSQTTARTFVVTFNAPIPDTTWSITYTATAAQDAPVPSGSACGNATTPNVCATPQISAYLFQGVQGTAGPIAFFRGAYDAADVYYQNAVRVDVVTYADYYWRVNNADKNNTASWGTPAVNTGDWLLLGPVSSGPGGYNSAGDTVNIGGNSTITPTSANHTETVALTGAAGARILALATTGRNPGDRVDLVLTLPATAGIVITVRSGSVSGAQLLPAADYPSNAYTTDGVTLSATWSFFLNSAGTAWTFARGNSPS